MVSGILQKDEYGIPLFLDHIKNKEFTYTRDKLDIMQINLGKLCNLSCKHCHVGAGPSRQEIMDKSTMEICLNVFKENGFKTMDITGGAPEMNPYFEWLVEEAAEAAEKVIVRTNLVILEEPEYRHLIDFYVKHKVEVVCSLPYYSTSDTDRQRGTGVFDKSIKVLHALNKAGYGIQKEFNLNLVYNPGGAYLPPDQNEMELQYKKELKSRFNIHFNNLFTITNNPVGRFKEFLIKSNNIRPYMQKLYGSFNVHTVENMMFRNQLSVSWDGKLYDCDFNQAIDLGTKDYKNVSELMNQKISRREILFGQHCYACTSGLGSSCGGATV